MFHIVYLICSITGPQCGSVVMPQAFSTIEACRANGSENAASTLLPKPGEGGATVNAFVCLKG